MVANSEFRSSERGSIAGSAVIIAALVIFSWTILEKTKPAEDRANERSAVYSALDSFRASDKNYLTFDGNQSNFVSNISSVVAADASTLSDYLIAGFGVHRPICIAALRAGTVVANSCSDGSGPAINLPSLASLMPSYSLKVAVYSKALSGGLAESKVYALDIGSTTVTTVAFTGPNLAFSSGSGSPPIVKKGPTVPVVSDDTSDDTVIVADLPKSDETVVAYSDPLPIPQSDNGAMAELPGFNVSDTAINQDTSTLTPPSTTPTNGDGPTFTVTSDPPVVLANNTSNTSSGYDGEPIVSDVNISAGGETGYINASDSNFGEDR